MVRDGSDIYIMGGVNGNTGSFSEKVLKYDLTNPGTSPMHVASFDTRKKTHRNPCRIKNSTEESALVIQ